MGDFIEQTMLQVVISDGLLVQLFAERHATKHSIYAT